MTPDGLDLDRLEQCFKAAGVRRVVVKQLAQNDNAKQQIYLGSSFEVLQNLPFSAVIASAGLKRPNFKAALNFHWLNAQGHFEPAKGAQLILYPDYPEVRLSGFLNGCAAAPSEWMQPVDSSRRGPKNAWDGRTLVMGITDEGRILAALAAPKSAASLAIDARIKQQKSTDEVLKEWVIDDNATAQPLDTQRELLRCLHAIHAKGPVDSVKLGKDGVTVPYNAVNGGGYTLEAHLGVQANSRAEPDFLGWEIKAYSRSRLTLMTPEPQAGFYGEQGAQAFLHRYGYLVNADTLYFTGTHKVGVQNPRSLQTMHIQGYDRATAKVVDVDGGIMLLDEKRECSAMWRFSDLIAHWNKKHSQAAYVKYVRLSDGRYTYLSPVGLGVGTSFTHYLACLHDGKVIYDPGTKLTGLNSAKPKVKARNQFRIGYKNVGLLYQHFSSKVLTPVT